MTEPTPTHRLEQIRAAIRADNVSCGELADLQGLVDHIAPDDIELLEAAGVPESDPVTLSVTAPREGAPMTQPKNLTQLKRACTLGQRVHITNRRRPQATRNTEITRVSTVDLITRATRDDGTVVEHSHLGWGKAGDWRFDDNGAHVLDHVGKPWLTVRILAPTETP